MSSLQQGETSRNEPLLVVTAIPDYPWQSVGSDLFELKGHTYLLIADYYLHYPETFSLPFTTSASIIRALKAMFSQFGVPEVLCSDNRPQYTSQEFSRFLGEYGIVHLTSSPQYPQSNGFAERMIETVKSPEALR